MVYPTVELWSSVCLCLCVYLSVPVSVSVSVSVSVCVCMSLPSLARKSTLSPHFYVVACVCARTHTSIPRRQVQHGGRETMQAFDVQALMCRR